MHWSRAPAQLDGIERFTVDLPTDTVTTVEPFYVALGHAFKATPPHNFAQRRTACMVPKFDRFVIASHWCTSLPPPPIYLRDESFEQNSRAVSRHRPAEETRAPERQEVWWPTETPCPI